MSLEGKVAIVTGASKGVGLATTQLLLEKGVKVAGWSRTAASVKHANFRSYPADLRRPDSIRMAYEATVREFGKEIAILINNAGIGYKANFEELPIEQWHEMFDINVHGIFYCSRLLIPGMKARGEGHIINVSSTSGKMGTEGFSGYCGTKFAVQGISQAMYKELREFGIKVTCVSPGAINTHFFDNIDSIQANPNMLDPADVATALVQVLESSPHCHPIELEVRSMGAKPKK
jgi:NAD(P)-dependent dehydrogenase (short-subunit alcohol dehydrogenase family)